MKEILKYQELDLEIQRMEGELLEHADRKNAIKMQFIELHTRNPSKIRLSRADATIQTQSSPVAYWSNHRTPG